MRNNKLCAFVLGTFIAIAAPVFAQSSAIEISVTTVDELLKMENKKVLEDDQKGATGASAMTAVRKPPKLPPKIVVQSISGTAGDIQATLVFNGKTIDNVKPGVQIGGGCEVKAIEGSCVKFIPVNEKKTKTKLCPTTCWTGVQNPIDPVQPQGRGEGKHSRLRKNCSETLSSTTNE